MVKTTSSRRHSFRLCDADVVRTDGTVVALLMWRKSSSERLTTMIRRRIPHKEVNPFSHHRTKRRTAFAALLVWAFALGSGVANACLLEAPGAHAHTSPHVAIAGTAAGPMHVGPLDHAETVDSDGGDESGIPKESCLKVCDDESNALVKLQTGSDLSPPGMAPCVSVVWNASASTVSTASQLDGLDPPIAGPPFRVRYSRLAL